MLLRRFDDLFLPLPAPTRQCGHLALGGVDDPVFIDAEFQILRGLVFVITLADRSETISTTIRGIHSDQTSLTSGGGVR